MRCNSVTSISREPLRERREERNLLSRTTCYFYINVAGREVNEFSVLGVEIVVFVPAASKPAPTSAVIDRRMIGIRGFPSYGKHTLRLQASSLCGRKSPRSCLYISGRCPSVNPHLFARATSNFSASLPSSQGVRGRKGEKIRPASAVHPSRT